MIRWLRCGLAAMVILLGIAPVQVLAYSYGDANTEDVAETFKLIESSLNGASLDWKAAEEAHKVRRSEIASHFGEAVAVTLDKNIEAKDGKLLVANYKAVLVMNLDRRFNYAYKDVTNYAGAKLLLAKGKATFDTLAPYLGSGTDELSKAFDEALDSLGNPGLFGVGKKEVNPEIFKEKTDYIYGKIKPSFTYTAYTEPAVPEPAAVTPESETAPAKADTVLIEAAPADAATATEEAVIEAEPAAEEAAAAAVAEKSEPAAEPKTEQASAAEITDSEPEAEGAASEVISETVQAATAEHAPMERTSKTNVGVTVFVIGGVVVVGGGALWVIRKKGLI